MAKVTVSKDMVGNTYNMLRVIAQKGAICECVCDCGVVVFVKGSRLLSGNNKSCGCRKRNVLGDSKRTHGRANSRLSGYTDRTYGIWQAMKDRCSNPNRHDWARYGGAGITVHDEWATSFEAFVRDMGEAPPEMSLDRIDGTKGYSPDNCKWSTYKEQVLNQKRTQVYELDGVKNSVRGWAILWGISWKAAKKRLTAV